MSENDNKNKKIKVISGFFALLIFISIIVTPLLSPREAKALTPDPTVWASAIWREIKEAARWVKDKAWETSKDLYKVATDVAIKNSLRVFLGKLAEDTAIWISSAGTGQKPLFITEPGKYFEDLTQAAAGDFLYSLGANVFGINVCEPNLGVKMSITFALNKTFNPETWCQDSCEYFYNNKVRKINDLYSGEVVLSSFRDDDDVYPEAGVITYFQKYASSDRIGKFVSAHMDGDFLCPVNCPNVEGPPLPGTICAGASYASSPEQATSVALDPHDLELSLTNLQGCISTLQNLSYMENQSAQGNRKLCLANCKKGVRKARCTASDVFNNVESMKDETIVPDLVNIYLQPEQNDIGQLLIIYGLIDEKTQRELAREQALYENQIGPVTTKVSREVLSPREAVQARLDLAIDKSTAAEEVYTGSIKADVLTIFTNTLVNKLIERFYGGKCALNPGAEGCSGPTGGSKLSQIVFGPGGPAGIAAAKLQFASISKINYSRGSPGQDPVASSNLASEGIIDSGFQTAIDQQMTVGEAINNGLIGGTFGFDAEGREPSIDSGVPYRTILYLRNYRVVPVGWELAAKWIQDHPQNVTLEQLAAEEFYNCDSGGNSTCSDNDEACEGNSDCRDYPLCPEGTCADSTQVCIVEYDGGPAACYDSCETDEDCGENATCLATPESFTGHCVDDDQPYCQYEAAASPFCGLVDPGWVLKMPDTYCEKRGASEEIISKEYLCSEDTNKDDEVDCTGNEENYENDIGEWQVIRNTDRCADEISCLVEDVNGKCLKYGYCFEERPSFKFNGDQCSRQYVSCQSLVRSDGLEFSYLTNTVDNNGCDVTNAGCRWYCQDSDPTGQWLCTADTGNKIHFDRDVQECSQSEVGCQEFIRYGEGVNYFSNGSFEYYTGEVDDGVNDLWDSYTPGYPTIWVGDFDYDFPYYTCGAAAQAVSDSYAGSVAAKLIWKEDCPGTDPAHYLVASEIETGHPILNRTFTVSFYAKASGACAMRSILTNGLGGVAWAEEAAYSGDFSLTTSWRRYSYTTTFEEDNIAYSGGVAVNPNKLSLRFRPVEGYEIYLDAIQIEEGGLTDYKDYGTSGITYLNQTRVSCSENDVGCDKYTPTKGGTAIPGVVYSQNLCSSGKVGCSAFQEMDTENIPLREGEDPIYFIAGTGTQCSAADVGCEEYTNLDEVAAGGEGKEYFKQIRQCVKPEAPDLATYYTWEGDDVSGYQLRAFELKRSNFDGSPCTNLSVSGISEEPVCLDDATNIASCSPGEMAYNPDCTEYYDAQATVYYRLRSRVIESTENCKSYRNTIDTQLGLGDDRIYYIDPTKSLKCSATNAGCREYKGNTGQVTRPVFEDNFEDSTVAASNWVSGFLSNESLRANEHSLRVVGSSTGTSPAVLEGKLAQGQEYYLSFWLKPETATTIDQLVIQNNGTSGPELALSFISAPITLTQDWNRYSFGPLRFTRPPEDFEQIAISTDGSFFLDNVLLEEVSDTTYLIKGTFVRCTANDLGCEEYKDSKGNLHYIKSFDHLCEEKYIGCEAMMNTQNSDYPYQQTIKEITVPADTPETIVYDSTKLCPAEAKGCDKFGLPVLNILEEPEDWLTRYLINDPDKYNYSNGERDASIVCLSAHDGCDEYTYTNGEGVIWFKDPNRKTCEYKLLGNEYNWYKTATNNFCPITTPPVEGKPVGKACVKVCTEGIYQGLACVLDSDCPGAVDACGGVDGSVGNSCNVDSDCPSGYICDYWVGLCPQEQSGCNEYRDPSDPENCRSICSLEETGGDYVPVDDNCNPTLCSGGSRAGDYCYSAVDCPGGACSGNGIPGCRSYYYIRDTVEENREECGNMIDYEEGCLPFNDTSNPELNMRGI